MEEDSDLKDDIVEYAVGINAYTSQKEFMANRDHLLRMMDYRAYVSLQTCSEVGLTCNGMHVHAPVLSMIQLESIMKGCRHSGSAHGSTSNNHTVNQQFILDEGFTSLMHKCISTDPSLWVHSALIRALNVVCCRNFFGQPVRTSCWLAKLLATVKHVHGCPSVPRYMHQPAFSPALRWLSSKREKKLSEAACSVRLLWVPSTWMISHLTHLDWSLIDGTCTLCTTCSLALLQSEPWQWVMNNRALCGNETKHVHACSVALESSVNLCRGLELSKGKGNGKWERFFVDLLGSRQVHA